MKLGNFKIFVLFFILFFFDTLYLLAENKIETVPLINLEELSPTFEEDKDELEKIEDFYHQANCNNYSQTHFPKKNNH